MKILCSLVLLMVSLNAVAATEISPGQLYNAGARLKVSALGVEFSVPQGWRALLPPAAEVVIMEPLDQSARMFVMAQPDKDRSAVEADMNEATELDAGLVIRPAGAATLRDGLYRQRYAISGPNPQRLSVSSLGRLGDNQVAVYAILLQAPDQPDKTSIAESFMRGMGFTAIVAPATQAGQGGDIDWNSELRGRTLQYLKTGNGLSVDKRLNLCSNGTAVYSDHDSYFSGGVGGDFSAYSNSGDVGQWSINASRLTVNWNDGSRSTYNLSRRYVEKWGEWGTFLDDDRWFNNANQVCP
jgi:hypothetical protein